MGRHRKESTSTTNADGSVTVTTTTYDESGKVVNVATATQPATGAGQVVQSGSVHGGVHWHR